MINAYEIFAERLTEYMQLKGWSLRQFARESSIPVKTLHNWIARKNSPKLHSLVLLAQFMDCTTDYLLGLSDE